MANISGSSSEYGQPNAVFLDAANDFFTKYGLDFVEDLSDISALQLMSVYELLFGHDKPIKDLIHDVVTREDDVHNVQCLIDCLMQDHLLCDLSHISAAEIVDGDVTNIKYLMELFLEIETLIMEETGEGSEQAAGPLISVRDHDFLTEGTIDTISQVLQEEGIQSPPTRDVQSETSFRSGDSKLPSSISGDLEQHEFESDVSMDSMIHMRGRPTRDPMMSRLKPDSPVGTSEHNIRQVDRRKVLAGHQEQSYGGGKPNGSHLPRRSDEGQCVVSERGHSRPPKSADTKSSTYPTKSSMNAAPQKYQRSSVISDAWAHNRQDNTGGVMVAQGVNEPTEEQRGGALLRGKSGRPGREGIGGRASPHSGDTSETLTSTQELIRLGDEAIYGKSAVPRDAANAQISKKRRTPPVSVSSSRESSESQGDNRREAGSFGQPSAKAYQPRSLALGASELPTERSIPRSQRGLNITQPTRSVSQLRDVTHTTGIREGILSLPRENYGTRSRAKQSRLIRDEKTSNVDLNGPSSSKAHIGIRGEIGSQRNASDHDLESVVQLQNEFLIPRTHKKAPIISDDVGNRRYTSKESQHPRVPIPRDADPVSRGRTSQGDQSRWNVPPLENDLRRRGDTALQGDAFPYTRAGLDDSEQGSFKALIPCQDSQISNAEISPRKYPSRGRDSVKSRQTLSLGKDSTCSSFSSAAWPEPPRPSSLPGGELASLGTGLRRDEHPLPGPPERQRMTRHTHTHHHYHQPVVIDAGHAGSSEALASSLPVAPAISQTLPPASSTLVPPVVSASAPTSPVRGSADSRYPKERMVATSTAPSRLPEREEPSAPQPERKTKPVPPSRGENSRRQTKLTRVTKSRSWEEAAVIRKEKLDKPLAGQKEPSKSRSFEMYDVAGPSNVRCSQQSCKEPPGPPRRKVAFHLTDPDSESEDEDDIDRLAEMALLQKLRNRFSSSSDEGSDSDISVHSDSIIDYSRASNDPETPKRKPRQRPQKPQRRKKMSPVSGSLLLGRSPPRGKPPKVRFEEALDSKAKGTMGKIRRDVGREKKRQDIERKTIEFLYSAGLRELQRDMEEQDERRKQLVRKQNLDYKRKVLKKPKTSISQPAKKYAPRLVPPVSPKRSRRAGQRSKRKRSPSPRIRRQKRLTVEDDDVLPLLMTEFPFLHVSPETAHVMWTKQLRQVEQLTKIGVEQSKNNQMHKKIEDAERRQRLLMGIMKKELSHNQRMKELKEKKTKKMQLQRRERERRHVTARARRYYDEFRVQSQARMAKKKTKEEKIFKNLFDEALKIQKSRVMELRKYARDKKKEMAERQQDEIESMENYYHDQFDLLAETLQNERREVAIKDTAQAKVLEQMKRSMRRRMEDEIRDYQDELYRDEDSAHYRGLDAERIKQALRDAAYKTQL